MTHLAPLGALGLATATAVGLLAAMRAGRRDVRTALVANWPPALALGLASGAVLGGVVWAWFGTFADGVAIGAVGFVVAFIHGLDI